MILTQWTKIRFHWCVVRENRESASYQYTVCYGRNEWKSEYQQTKIIFSWPTCNKESWKKLSWPKNLGAVQSARYFYNQTILDQRYPWYKWKDVTSKRQIDYILKRVKRRIRILAARAIRKGRKCDTEHKKCSPHSKKSQNQEEMENAK